MSPDQQPPIPPLYVEVEDGERVVLPHGMTEADLLRSLLRQLLPTAQTEASDA